MVSERSVGTLLLALLAAALVGVSFALPWFSYEHSTGRRTPEGGFHAPEEDGVIVNSWQAQPGSSSGTLESEDPAATERTLDIMAWSLYAAIGLLVVVALGDIPGISRIIVRRVSLGLCLLAFAAVVTALAYAWFVLPGTFGHSVNDPYTSFRDDGGYTMTAMRAGWAWAALALPAMFAAFLFKFQAGAPDPTVVAELYAQGEL